MPRKLIHEDLLFTVPNYDDDSGSYSEEHIWGYFSKGRVHYTSSDSCGNHEPVTAAYARKLEKEQNQLWEEYYWHVVQDGTDWLGVLHVSDKVKKRARVSLLLKLIGRRLVCVGVVYKKDVVNPGTLPAGLREWAEIKRRSGRWYFHYSPKELRSLRGNGNKVRFLRCKETGALTGAVVTGTAVWEEPKAPETLVKEVRSQARKRLIAIKATRVKTK
jgi:hypothetical protein